MNAPISLGFYYALNERKNSGGGRLMEVTCSEMCIKYRKLPTSLVACVSTNPSIGVAKNSSFHSALSLDVSLSVSSSHDSGHDVSSCSCCSIATNFLEEFTKGLTTAMKQIMTPKKVNTKVL